MKVRLKELKDFTVLFLGKQLSVKDRKGGVAELEAAQSVNAQDKNLVNNEGFWTLI